MSSATPSDPNAVNAAVYSGAMMPGGLNGGMNPRQALLNRYWSYYRCQNYDNRSRDWNGHENCGPLEHEQIATEGYIPPGFVAKNYTELPLKFRRPTAPYYLAKIVVERFTGLLFGDSKRPKIVALGDQDTTDYLEGLAEAGRLWPAMTKARNYGGAMGTAIVGFSLVGGHPLFEVHDARWCTPKFNDRHNLILASIEIRYVFLDYARNHKGEWEEVPFWYRRVINETSDAVWDAVRVVEGLEPNWAVLEKKEVTHGLGLCPVVWIQNTDHDETTDGDPDCYGAFDLIESYDALMAQANKGTLANSDPTLVITSDADLPEIKKGSDNAIQIEKGASANYLELEGAGPRAARELAEVFRERAYEMTACVPDQNTAEGPAQTATEVITRMSRMIERANQFRDRYGEQGLKRLLGIALIACRKATGVRLEERTAPNGVVIGVPVQGTVLLPPKMAEDPATGVERPVPRKLGPSNMLALSWPRFFEPTLDDTTKAVDAMVKALPAGLIDKQTAVEYLSHFLPIENVRVTMDRIEKEAAAQKQASEAAMAAQMRGEW